MTTTRDRPPSCGQAAMAMAVDFRSPACHLETKQRTQTLERSVGARIITEPIIIVCCLFVCYSFVNVLSPINFNLISVDTEIRDDSARERRKLSFKSRVGRNMALHASSAARNSTLLMFIQFHFPNSSLFFLPRLVCGAGSFPRGAT